VADRTMSFDRHCHVCKYSCKSDKRLRRLPRSMVCHSQAYECLLRIVLVQPWQEQFPCHIHPRPFHRSAIRVGGDGRDERQNITQILSLSLTGITFEFRGSVGGYWCVGLVGGMRWWLLSKVVGSVLSTKPWLLLGSLLHASYIPDHLSLSLSSHLPAF